MALLKRHSVIFPRQRVTQTVGQRSVSNTPIVSSARAAEAFVPRADAGEGHELRRDGTEGGVNNIHTTDDTDVITVTLPGHRLWSWKMPSRNCKLARAAKVHNRL